METGISPQKLLQRLAFVGTGVIQQHHHGTVEMPKQVAEEQTHFFLPNIGPSSRPPLLGASPLRTGRESFPSSGSSPSNASFRETRFRYGKMLAMNPVVALWMEQDAVFCTRGTTQCTGDAMMKAPTRDPGDLGVAHGTEPALELPEKAKSPRTPKRFRHMICFAFFEVGFIDGIVRISGALDLDVPLNGRATGEE
jgi:hypothetical protein